ncbi:DUF423 domain-containing protein [bacterium]|nr:MAG: DUF423 domain-containing protein [bacterium]
MDRKWVTIGAALATAGVALGAFGAHGLKGRVDASLIPTWETAAHYHQYHALALIVIGLLPAAKGKNLAANLLLAGLLVFAISLYVYVLSGVRILGAITPLGGAMMIAGWIVLAVSYGKKADV